MREDSKDRKVVISSRGSFWGKKTPRPDLLDETEQPKHFPVEEPDETPEPLAEEPESVDERPNAADQDSTEEAPRAQHEIVTEPVELERVEVEPVDVEPNVPEPVEAESIDAEPEDIEIVEVVPAEVDAEAEPEAEPEPEVEPEPEQGPEPTVEPMPQPELEPKPKVESELPRKEAPKPAEESKSTTTSAQTKKPRSATAKTQQAKPKEKGKEKGKGKGKPAQAKSVQTKSKDQEQEPTPASSEEESSGSPFVRTVRSLWKHHRAATIVGIATCLIIIVTYIAGGMFFSSHFLPRTTVNGNDVSMISTSTFADRIASEAKDYSALVTGDGMNFSVAANDVSLVLDTDTYVNTAKSQVPSWLWPFAIIVPQAYTVSEGVSLDEGKLSEIVSPIIAKASENATPTANASIYYDEEAGGFKTVAEKLGTELDTDAVLDKIAIGMEGLNPTITLDEADLVQPTVTLSDSKFKDALAEVKKYPDLEIELQMGGETVKTLDSDLVRSWLCIADDFSVTGDVDSVAVYTRGTLSSELDSVGGFRTYTRPDGKEIQINDGTYGWNIDGAELAELIVDRINEKSSKPIEVPCISSAAVYNPGGADWGKRYIDVDLTEQFARMYGDDGSLIWSSECVSGGPAEGNDTVTGVFAIEGKESPATLIGLDSNGDGEPDYENEVTYWMPFFGGYGLHDATWRYTFGGEEYLYDGSHGCVNLPYSAAELLYFNVQVGDAVIVHW